MGGIIPALSALAPLVRVAFPGFRFALGRLATLPGARTRTGGRYAVGWRQLSDLRHIRISAVRTGRYRSESGQLVPLLVGEQFVEIDQDQKLAVAACHTLNVTGALVAAYVGRRLNL